MPAKKLEPKTSPNSSVIHGNTCQPGIHSSLSCLKKLSPSAKRRRWVTPAVAIVDNQVNRHSDDKLLRIVESKFETSTHFWPLSPSVVSGWITRSMIGFAILRLTRL